MLFEIHAHGQQVLGMLRLELARMKKDLIELRSSTLKIPHLVREYVAEIGKTFTIVDKTYSEFYSGKITEVTFLFLTRDCHELTCVAMEAVK